MMFQWKKQNFVSVISKWWLASRFELSVFLGPTNQISSKFLKNTCNLIFSNNFFEEFRWCSAWQCDCNFALYLVGKVKILTKYVQCTYLLTFGIIMKIYGFYVLNSLRLALIILTHLRHFHITSKHILTVVSILVWIKPFARFWRNHP